MPSIKEGLRQPIAFGRNPFNQDEINADRDLLRFETESRRGTGSEIPELGDFDPETHCLPLSIGMIYS